MRAFSLHDGAAVGRFTCVFPGQLLEPLGRLSHYGIVYQSTIWLTHHLRGGGMRDPTPKRMALGAGGAISQNIKRDMQDPAIWDPSRAIRINVQIVNSLAFKEMTDLIAPLTPISCEPYRSLGIPFFQYYDPHAVSGDFAGIRSVDSSHVNSSTVTAGTDDLSWTTTPDKCAKCHQRPPYRL